MKRKRGGVVKDETAEEIFVCVCNVGSGRSSRLYGAADETVEVENVGDVLHGCLGCAFLAPMCGREEGMCIWWED